MRKINTGIQHVTQPNANIFTELGFTSAETENYQVEARKLINDAKALKEQLMAELALWIKENHLLQDKAAEILYISCPRVSDVINKKTTKFTIDALINMLMRIGKPIKIVIG